MSNPNYSLSERELEYISRYFGRVPTESEKKIVGQLWDEYRQYHYYRDIIRQAGSGVDEVPVVEVTTGKISGAISARLKCNIPKSTLIPEIGKILVNLHSLNSVPKAVNIYMNGKSPLAKAPVKVARLSKELKRSSEISIKTLGIPGESNRCDLFGAGYENPEAGDQDNYRKGTLGLVNIDIVDKPDDSNLVLTIMTMFSELSEKPWVMGYVSNNGSNLINDISSYIDSLGQGFETDKSLVVDGLSTNENVQALFIIHFQAGFENDLKNILEKGGFGLEILGNLTGSPGISVSASGQIQAQVPAELYYPDPSLIEAIPYDIPSEHDLKQVDQSTLINGKSKFNQQTIELVNHCQIGGLDESGKVSRESIIIDEKEHVLLLSQNRNQRWSAIDPYLSGSILVAEGVRRLACVGGRVQNITANLPIVKNLNSEYLTVFNSAARGIAGACRNLGLSLGNVSFRDPLKKPVFDPVVGIAGLGNTEVDFITSSFRNEGDFITILGSLRGELGGSEYMQYFNQSVAGNLPTIDFSMERRIREAVVQGIEEGLIKSATSLGKGGLAATLARGIASAPEGLGARIHLSRKLLPEELLFGETQGIVIISIDENDLMEFERICMNIGVPSTTIGRVTDSGQFTFNDLIKLPVEELKSILHG